MNKRATLVEITAVDSANAKSILAHHIEFPKPGSPSDLYAMDISGWILGSKSPVVEVKVLYQGYEVRTTPVNVLRPDVAKTFPAAPNANQCGFRTLVGLFGMTLEFEIELWVILEDKSRIYLGTIRGRRQPLLSDFQPTIQPLMITGLGRSGTTWLMRLLTEHESIVAHNEYPYEIRNARYLLHMLKVLSEPANHFQSSLPNAFHADMRWIGHNPFYTPAALDDPQLRRWFGKVYPEQLAVFCQQNIEMLYQGIAEEQARPATHVHYFVEKHVPDHIQDIIWELYPQAREVFLVRDFRDRICSILAFNAKRGYTAFGRERFANDKEYIRQQREYALRTLQSWKDRSERAFLLHYEDLILSPVESLKNVLAYLEIDSTCADRILQKALETTQALQQHQTSATPVASIGRWQHELDPSLQAVCEESFGDILEEFNYI